MNKPSIVCVDDQREVLAALEKDLDPFKEHLQVIECESAGEAHEVLDELEAEGSHPALIICDHVMPDQDGVSLLIELNNDARFGHMKKVLLTGLATHQDTINAINRAGIDRYIEKPWEAELLLDTVKILITEYLLSAGLEYQDFLPVIDQQTLYKKLHGGV